MSSRSRWLTVVAPYGFVGLVVVYSLLGDSPVLRVPAASGCLGGGLLIGGGRGIGGISIDPNGSLKNLELGDLKQLHDARAQALKVAPGDMKQAAPLRKISLRRLEAAINESLQAGKPLPDEIRLLAGLQNIHYVFVYPQEHDIVLAGFGEGWKIDDRGEVVGLTTGRPVMLLDDLLTAMRFVRRGVQGSITCSIDPTTEGLKRLQQYVASLTTIGNLDTTIQTIEQLLGPQRISLGGVPSTSHFAYVLLAADYRMKRLGMGFDPAPVTGFPSYLQMIKAGPQGMQSMTPRWWLVPNYDPVATDGQGLAYELRGSKVKCLTDETFFGDQGSRASTGKVSPIAQRWADLMTSKYDELSAKEPIFAELRNCMDLAIAAALIVKERMPERAGYALPLWLDSNRLPTEELAVPKQIDTQASFMRKGGSYVISASGGVEIQPWQFAGRTEKSDSVSGVRGQAAPQAATAWWWN